MLSKRDISFDCGKAFDPEAGENKYYEFSESNSEPICYECYSDIKQIKKMCTGCRQMYVPILKNDDDCCPSCSRY